MREPPPSVLQVYGDLIGDFLPKGLAVYCDGPQAELPLDAIEGHRVADAAQADLHVMIGHELPPETFLEKLRHAGTAVLCAPIVLHHPDVLAGIGRGEVIGHTLESFPEMVEEAGYQLATRAAATRDDSLLCLLLPRAAQGDRWWDGDGMAGILRHQDVQGIRQISKYLSWVAEGAKTLGWRLRSEPWRHRAELAAKLIPPGTRLMDIGCGAMYLEATARPSHYLPLDIEARDERTQVIDLDQQDVPTSWLDEVEVTALMGVMEYLSDPEALLRRLASHGKTLICSYTHQQDGRETRYSRRAKLKNIYSREDMEALFVRAGFAVTDTFAFSPKQQVWRLDPAEQGSDLRIPRGAGVAPEDLIERRHPADSAGEAKRVARAEREAAREERKAERSALREAKLRGRAPQES